jgi:outer membrane protein TolC
MLIRVLLIVPIALACAGAAVHAEPPLATADSVAVDDLLRIALRDNPELAAMRAGAGAAAARPAQARALPDPRFSYGWMGEHLETARGPQSSTYSLSQEIPFFGKRGLMGQMAERGARIAGESVRAMELEIAAEVRRMAAELVYLDEGLGIQAEDRRLLEEIHAIARTKYTTGTGRLENVAKIEVEQAENETEILMLERERQVARAELNRLLGRAPDSALPRIAGRPAPGPVAPVHPDSLNVLAEGRPEVRAAAEAIAASEAAVRLARRNYFPDFMVGGQYLVVEKGMSESPEAGTDAWMLELGVNVPIWRGKLGAGVREARQMEAESRAGRESARLRVQQEIVASEAHVRRTGEIVAVYGDKFIPRAEVALASARSGYQTGAVDFLDLLDSERLLISTRLAAAAARADFAKSAADLARATAQPLPAAAGVTP